VTEESVNDGEKIVDAEKQSGQEDAGDTNKDSSAAEPEEKEPEEKVTVILVKIIICFACLHALILLLQMSQHYHPFC